MFSNRPGVIAASIVLPLCATVAVGLRFYARHVKGLPRGIDDWAVVPCTVSISPMMDRKVALLTIAVFLVDTGLDLSCYLDLGYAVSTIEAEFD